MFSKISQFVFASLFSVKLFQLPVGYVFKSYNWFFFFNAKKNFGLHSITIIACHEIFSSNVRSGSDYSYIGLGDFLLGNILKNYSRSISIFRSLT